MDILKSAKILNWSDGSGDTPSAGIVGIQHWHLDVDLERKCLGLNLALVLNSLCLIPACIYTDVMTKPRNSRRTRK